MKRVMVSASTNPPKEDDLIDYVKKIDGLIDFMHCDVMDGKFVKSKCLSSEKVKEINEISSVKLDCHLMVKNPTKKIKRFAKAGANLITVHYEAFKSKIKLRHCLNKIKEYNCLCGLAINPDTKVEQIKRFLPIVDVVLVMSVVPGKSGQEFMFSVLHKIKTLSQIRFAKKYNYLIEVDGGINNKISATLINNGADILVSGSFLYKSSDYKQTIFSLKY